MATFGADIEVWIKKEGKVIPPFVAMGGDKIIPLPHGELFADGWAAEFTLTPSLTLEEMGRKIDENLETIRSILSEYEVDYETSFQEVDLSFVAAVPKDLPPEVYKRVGLDIFGCNADLNVYGYRLDRPDPTTYPYRSIGGHIHIGDPRIADQDDYEVQESVVSMIDMTATGLYALFGTEQDWKRRKLLYGAYGTYRPKPYGIEYRVFPARFLCNPEIRPSVFEAVESVAEQIPGLAKTYKQNIGLGRRAMASKFRLS